MVVWLVLVLAAAVMAKAAIPDPPNTGITTVGSLKLATAADCAGVVAFSAKEGTRPADHARITYATTLVDKAVGYVAQTGIFTTHCPGLYQFSFAGYGNSNLRLTLKLNATDSWQPVVSAGPGGGSNLVLLDVEAGHQVAVFADSGKVTDGVTFSGHRIAKK